MIFIEILVNHSYEVGCHGLSPRGPLFFQHTIFKATHQHYIQRRRSWWKVQTTKAQHHNYTSSINTFIEIIETHSYMNEWRAPPPLCIILTTSHHLDRDINITDTRNARDEMFIQQQKVITAIHLQWWHSSPQPHSITTNTLHRHQHTPSPPTHTIITIHCSMWCLMRNYFMDQLSSVIWKRCIDYNNAVGIWNSAFNAFSDEKYDESFLMMFHGNKLIIPTKARMGLNNVSKHPFQFSFFVKWYVIRLHHQILELKPIILDGKSIQADCGVRKTAIRDRKKFVLRQS